MGTPINTDAGEIDHILPRTSGYGTINDEANLIYASESGNKKKGNDTYSFDNLKKEYKKELFGTTDPQEIQRQIEEQLGDGKEDNFPFGQYRSFINLSFEQQKAFRHALFLPEGDELRKKVINAINNRNRAFVSGTQRYFADVVANNLHKLAKRIGREKLISFDFFGVDAGPSSSGKSIYDLRKWHEDDRHIEAVKKYKKQKGIPQEPYSHLLDAQLAFVIAADAHRNEGGFKLQLDEGNLREPVDLETGEYKKGMLEDILIDDDGFTPTKLSRQATKENFSAHRSYTRDTFYADHYLPILLKREGKSKIKIRIGFDWKNSVEQDDGEDIFRFIMSNTALFAGIDHLETGDIHDMRELYTSLEKSKPQSKQFRLKGYFYLTVNKTKLHQHWMELFNTANGTPFETDGFVQKKLMYKTEKVLIEKPEDIEKCLSNEKSFTIKINDKPVIHPVEKDWRTIKKAWDEYSDNDFRNFLKGYFSNTAGKHDHQKVRKSFSLPVITQQGKMLVRKRSWNGKETFQILNDADPRKDGNKYNVPVRKQDGSIGKKLAKWATSENIVMLVGGGYETGKEIDPDQWFKLPVSDTEFPEGVEQIWYQIKDSTAPRIAIKLGKSGRDLDVEILEDPLCKHGFRGTKGSTAKEKRDEFFNKEVKPMKKGSIVIYDGGKIMSRKDVKKALKLATEVEQAK